MSEKASEEKIILLTTSYIAPSNRLKELVESLSKNVANKFISEIHIAVEEPKDVYKKALDGPLSGLKRLLDNAKVRTFNVGGRTTYRVLFDYANKHLAGKIVMVSNSDIWFDETVNNLKSVDFDNLFICLSRQDRLYVAKNPTMPYCSQDTWIFRTPIRGFSCDWFLGPRGSDNKLAFEAGKAGFRLLNPCYGIRSHHLHASNYRVGATVETVPGPYAHVAPCGLPELVKGKGNGLIIRNRPDGPQSAFSGTKKETSRKLDIKPKGPW